MSKRVAIIQGHSDPFGQHPLHAMANAYADRAQRATCKVRSIDTVKLEFPRSHGRLGV